MKPGLVEPKSGCAEIIKIVGLVILAVIVGLIILLLTPKELRIPVTQLILSFV